MKFGIICMTIGGLLWALGNFQYYFEINLINPEIFQILIIEDTDYTPYAFGVFGFFIYYYALQKNKGADALENIKLNKDEKLIKNAHSSYYEGKISQVHGNLILTNQRIIFKGFGKSKGEDFDEVNDFDIIIPNSDIENIESGLTLTIQNREGKKYKFAVGAFKAKTWKKEITNYV